MTDRLEIKAEVAIDDTGTVTGIAWPFGTPDRVGDVIEKGAFSFASSLPMVMEHDQKQVVGIWEDFTETERGLEVKGRLFVEGIDPARIAHEQLKSRRIGGLSIGFRHSGFDPRPEGGRVFKAVTVTEISLCRVPVHPGAQVMVVKAEPPKSENVMSENVANDAEGIDPKTFAEVKSRLDKLEAKANRPQGVIVTSPEVTTERKAFGSYLRHDKDRMGEEVKALTVADNANGGFLAPSEFSSELLKLLNEFSPIRQYARVMQVTAPEVIMPRRASGTAAFWTSEGDDAQASGMTFEQVKIENHELATYVDVSNKLLEDNAYNLEGELLADFSERFGAVEGLAFVKGTGVGQPKGIMTATGIKEVKTGAAAAFPSTNPADVLIGMYHAIPTGHAQRAVWLMNRFTLAEVRKWKDGQGRYLVIDPQDGAPAQLLGRPVVEMPDMDDIGAGKFPILFGDLQGYRITDRVGLSILRDPYTLGMKSQVRFLARKRVGADLTHPDRFVKLKVSA